MGITTSAILYLSVYSVSAGLFALSMRVRNGRNICFLLSLFTVVVFAGMRYGVGTDYYIYMSMYRNFSMTSFRELFASGEMFENFVLVVFAKMAKALGGWKYFFGLYALSAYLPFLWLIRNKYKQVPVFILTFLYLTGMFTSGLNIMRQGTAVVIVFCAFQYVYERNFKKFFSCILLATLFHTSAAVAVVVYFIYGNIKFNKKKWSMVLLAIPLLLVVIFYKNIISFLSQFSLFEKYASYIEDGGTGKNRSFFLHCVILLGLWCFKKPLLRFDERNDLLFLLAFVGVALEAIGFEAVFVRRIASYFYDIPSGFLIAQLPMVLKKKDYYISCSLVYIYAVVMFILFFAVLKQADILPYNILEV